MNEPSMVLLMGVGIFVIAFAGPLVCGVLLHVRRRRIRASRRSPIGIDMLRSPGHTLKKSIEETSIDVSFDIVFLSVLPLMMVNFGGVLVYGGMPLLPASIGVCIVLLPFLAYLIRALFKKVRQLDRWRKGYDAELAVGQELDQLMRKGAYVFHDFPADGFNIDHIVIAEQGVFAVETKGYTKSTKKLGKAGATVHVENEQLRFPTWSSGRGLEQTSSQAAWLSKWLSSAAGDRVVATPVLALPGWYVERQGPSTVNVLNGKELYRLLDTASAGSLSTDLIRRVTHQVQARCRDVAPLFANDPKSGAAGAPAAQTVGRG